MLKHASEAGVTRTLQNEKWLFSSAEARITSVHFALKYRLHLHTSPFNKSPLLPLS